jgi:hypothetical protein
MVQSIAPTDHFIPVPHTASHAGSTRKGDPFAGRPHRMTQAAFAELKSAQGEIREALHGIDAIATRMRAAAASFHPADIDRIIEHLEAAVTRLRAIQELHGAER